MQQEEKLPGEGGVKPRPEGRAGVSQAKAGGENTSVLGKDKGSEARGEIPAPWRPPGCSTLTTALNYVPRRHTRHLLYDACVSLNLHGTQVKQAP